MLGVLILFLACAFFGFVWTALAPARPRLKGVLVGSLPALGLAVSNLSALADPMGLFFILLMLWAPGAAGGVAGAAAGASLARRRPARAEPLRKDFPGPPES